MRLDAKSGARGVLINADTGQPVRWARWADLETGEYEAFRADPRAAKRLGVSLESITYRGRARLRFLAAAPPAPRPTPPPAPLRRCRPIIAVAGQECEERGCHRLAEWLVSWEQEVEPEPLPNGGLAERAVMTEAHRYCSWHYRNPVFTSRRGVQSEVIVKARPQ